MSNITSHEKLCAERYKAIHEGMADMSDRVKDIKADMRWARNIAVALAIGIMSWLASQVYATLSADPPAEIERAE